MRWLILPIGLVLWVLFRFMCDYIKQKHVMNQQGGVRQKYSKLVDYCLSGHPDCRVFKETSTSMCIGCKGISGGTYFNLLYTFGVLIVEYDVDSVYFGKRHLEWKFDENMSQDEMIERISNDVRKQ